MRLDTFSIVWAGEIEPGRKAMRQNHADRHAFAMDEASAVVIRGGLERMAEGVPEIEKRAVARLELVAHDDIGLGAAGFGYGAAACRTSGEDFAPVRLQPGEEIRPVDQPVFRHLRIAGAEFALGKRIKGTGIGQHQLRLMEDADEILAMDGIDAGLAADGGVYLGQKRRGYLHEAH